MNVERLRAVQAEEREADSLRALPDSFYREVADYIQELRDERARAAEAAADPFGSEEVRRLTDEIETAEEVAEAIYERRVGKLVKRASLAAAGMPADEEGLTAEEADLFADLVAQIEDHRAEVLATFDGDRDAGGRKSGTVPDELVEEAANDESGAGAPETVATGDEGADATLDAGEAMGGSAEEPNAATGSSEGTPPPPPDEPVPEDGGRPDGGPGSKPRDDPPAESGDEKSTGGDDASGEDEATGDTERVTLRITRDVGEVFGVDERVYDLASEDVVTLPAANAKPLLDRDAAEQID